MASIDENTVRQALLNVGTPKTEEVLQNADLLALFVQALSPSSIQ